MFIQYAAVGVVALLIYIVISIASAVFLTKIFHKKWLAMMVFFASIIVFYIFELLTSFIFIVVLFFSSIIFYIIKKIKSNAKN